MTTLSVLAFLIYCITKTGHERHLETHPQWRVVYNPEWNKQRKRYMLLMTGSFAVILALFQESTIFFFLWEASVAWFIHEFGLSLARGQIETFGDVGTTSDIDILLSSICDKLKLPRASNKRRWFLRLIFTTPVIVFSFLI